MQIFPAVLRIAQSVAALSGADDSLAAINTSELSDGAVCVSRSNYNLYVLHKTSTATAVTPDIIAPAQGGPGRWFRYGIGATYFQALNVVHAAIPPQSSVDSAANVAGVLGQGDIIVFNSNDSSIPAGVIMGQPKVTGAGTAQFRFLNATAATVAAATVAIEAAVLKG